MEREIRSNANQARRVTPSIASLLSEVAILAKFRRQIAASRPWFASTRLIDKFALIAEFEKRTAHVEVMTETLHQLGDAKLGLSGTPLSKFKYPSEKRLTAAMTKEMRDAENTLDIFWHTVDHKVTNKMPTLLHEYLGGILRERNLARTPERAESAPVFKSEDTHEEDPETHILLDLLSKSALETTPSSEALAERTLLPTAKTKTRGVANESTCDDARVAEHRVF